LLSLASGEIAFAQSVGAILGTVTDNSGAVVPNAKVTATRTDTGISQTAVTGPLGTYFIPDLPVGSYSITAESPGFKSGNVEGIKLDVSQQRTVDFRLSLAGTQSTVEVTATPPLLNSTDATLAGLVSENR
jgi:hypothetical protein